MAILGIDCAAPLTKAKAKIIADKGHKFVARYLVPERLAWKRLTKAEAEAITANGMKVVSVFETTADRPRGGAAAGNADGLEALNEAKLIGQPLGTTIYFAVDYDAAKSDFDKIENYLRAVTAVLPGYNVGVYAEYEVIEEMSKRKACQSFWQTYAWSSGKKSTYANIYQYENGVNIEGMTIDLNQSFGNEGWWDTNPAPLPVTNDNEVKVIIDDVLVTTGKLVNGRIEAKLSIVLNALGIPFTYHGDQGKVYIYTNKNRI